MPTHVIVRYCYNGSCESPLTPSKACVHEILQSKVDLYIEKHASNKILKYDHVIELLKADGAQFYPNKVRYYNPFSGVYLQMEKTFFLDFSKNSNCFGVQSPITLYLWLKEANLALRGRLTTITQQIRKIDKQMELLLKSQEVFINTPSFYHKQMTESPMGRLDHFDPRFSFRKSEEVPRNSIPDQSYYPFPKGDETQRLPNGEMAFSFGKTSEVSKYSKYDRMGESNPLLRTNSSRKLDIAIMYAEPLVKIDGKGTYSLPDAVDYEEECNKIYETLEDKELAIQLTIEIASIDSFVKVLNSNPTILHILCHGEYDKSREQFYLCFENGNGELDRIFAEDLRGILEQVKPDIKLVFVNACHSEPVARVFADAGVPCVIAVQSQLQIADMIARKFAQEFYNFIFDGNPIGKAFTNALWASKSPASRSCCCAHQHKSTCTWYQMAMHDGYNKAHLFHDPLCTSCPKKCEHIHKFDCKWASDFMDAFGPTGWFNANPEFKSCCCSPHLPHDELLKFMKIAKDPEKSDNLVLFSSKEQGKVYFRKQNSVIDQKFPVKRPIGRNKIMHELCKILKSPQRVVKLIGTSGAGKTVLAKQLANYLFARNNFRNKIEIIGMDKFSSVSNFLSELFNEVEIVSDLKGFCEVSRAKDALFILEKCDTFIDSNRIEFLDSLNEIIEYTKSVKFILILNKNQDLKLGETAVEVKNLLAGDAAKLLLTNTPLEKIPLKYRNIEELKNSRLFKELKSFSPQTIWLVSQKLISNQPFERIESELIKNLQTISDENESDVAIETTLQEIQTENQQGFAFIMRLGVYPGGLMLWDLKDLARFDLIPENWVEILGKLLPESQESMNNSKQDSFLENKSIELSSLSINLKKGRSRKIEVPLPFNTGDYFWIQITKLANNEGLFFKPIQAVNLFLYKKLQQEIREAEMKKLEYLTLLSLFLLDKLRSISAYSERLLENSAICNHGLWAIRESNTFWIKHVRDRLYILPSAEERGLKTPKDIQSLYNIHEQNLSSCLNLSVIKSYLEQEETRTETLDIIEILWFSVLSLCKIFSRRPEAVVSLASRALNLLNELEIKETQLSLLKIKIHLMIIGIRVMQSKESAGRVQQMINLDIGFIDQHKAEITEKELIQRIDFEVAFAKAKFFYRLKKGRYEKGDNHIIEEGQKRYHTVIKILKESCDSILKNLPRCEFDRARVALLICKTRVSSNKGNIEEPFKERLINAARVFQQSLSLKLAIQANYSIAKLYYQLFLERSKMERPINILMKESAALDEIKKTHLKQGALAIAKMMNDTQFESKVIQLINLINSVIKQSFFNMVTMLHAFPIIQSCKTSDELSSSTLMSLNKQTTIPTFFKQDLLETLGERGKALNMKFEILNMTNLAEAIDTGCRILYIGSEVVHPEGIILEDSKGKAELMRYKDFKTLFLDSKLKRKQASVFGRSVYNDKNIDMIIVGSNNDATLAKYLVEELQVPHVIHFKFTDGINQDCFHRKLFEVEYITKFIQFFLNELISSKSVQESFDTAIRDTVDCIADSFFKAGDENKVKNFLGDGAILWPAAEKDQANPHEKKFFGIDDFVLSNGKIEDISTVRVPSNVYKNITPFFGRVQEMNEVIERILSVEPSGFMKILGDQGVGKTRFVLEVAYYLVQRNAFPDGIFYIPLRKIKSMKFFDILEKTLNSGSLGDSMDKNIKNFFRNKKMLLIFDDFDVFYSDQIIEFPSLILNILKRAKIPIILTCTNYDRKNMSQAMEKSWKHYKEEQNKIEPEYVGVTWHLKRLEDEHIARLLISLTSTKIDGISFDDALDHPGLTPVRGVPARLIQELRAKRILHKNRPLEINPYYTQFLNLDKRYGNLLKMSEETVVKEFLLNISRHSGGFNDALLATKQKERVSFAGGNKNNPNNAENDSMIRLFFEAGKANNSVLPVNRKSVLFNKSILSDSEKKEDRTPKNIENLGSLMMENSEDKKGFLQDSAMGVTITSVDEEDVKTIHTESIEDDKNDEGYFFNDEATVASEVESEVLSEVEELEEEKKQNETSEVYNRKQTNGHARKKAKEISPLLHEKKEDEFGSEIHMRQLLEVIQEDAKKETETLSESLDSESQTTPLMNANSDLLPSLKPSVSFGDELNSRKKNINSRISGFRVATMTPGGDINVKGIEIRKNDPTNDQA